MTEVENTKKQKPKKKTEEEILEKMTRDERIEYLIEKKKLTPFVLNDHQAQQRLFLLEGKNKFKYCQGTMYIFDERTGMYSTNKETLFYYLIKNGEWLNIRIGKKIDSYGSTRSLMNNVMQFVKTESEDNEWMRITDTSSLGYLLFQDGIYNMMTGEFNEGFNPNIVFYARIPHPFPQRKQSDVDYANKISFNQIFDNPEPIKTALACALAGNIELKKFYFCPGGTDAGKSFFCKMVKNAFGDYIGFFNAEALAYSGNNDNRDEAQKRRWSLLLRHCRGLFSNEVNMKKELDGNAIKAQSSGGDRIIGRSHNKEEVSFIPHYTIFCLLNDIPVIKPLDEGVSNRLLYINFPHVFVDSKRVNESSNYRLADPKLKDKIQEQRFINGFIHIIFDAYKKYLVDGMPEFDMDTKEKWTEEQKQSNMIINKIKEYFIISKDINDYLPKQELINWKKRNNDVFDTISPQKFNTLMEDLGIIAKKSQSGAWLWYGIKYANEDKTPIKLVASNPISIMKKKIESEQSEYDNENVTFDLTELEPEDLDLDFD
jgi:hypothetical protein